MVYEEQPSPSGLEDRVRAIWTLDCAADPESILRHDVAPDGCLEIITRHSGCSNWMGDQPAIFVAGMITAPIALTMSGDARFTAVRVWPWVWNALSDMHAPALINRWEALGDGWTGDALLSRIAAAKVLDVGAALVDAGSVQEMTARSGLSYRGLQRWFAREVGVPPRHYLRLLRFNEAYAGLQDHDGSLAAHAAAHGYADQAHMARDFRDLAGMPAKDARPKARGPFL